MIAIFANRCRFFLIATAVYLLLLPLYGQAQTYAEDSRITDEFIVMLKPGHTIDALMQDISKSPLEVSAKIEKCLSPRMGIYHLKRATTATSEEFLLLLMQNPHIKLAQYNHQVKQRSLIPNDPQFGSQWNMLNTAQSANSIAGDDIDATQAWELNHDNVDANGDTVVVAVIDYLFDTGHEDLNFFINHNEVGGNGIDDDGNGYIDDINGWNVFTQNGDVTGAGNHSTHCAGIVGAIGDNNLGIAGVCWGAKILAVAGTATTEAPVVEAYDYVRNMRLLYNNTFGTKGAYVVATNSSFGVDAGMPADFPIWCAMYDSMGEVGILSATATSNGFVDVDDVGDIPTQCPSKWMIAVTNTNKSDIKTAGYGRNSIDIGAPGSDIRSTIPQSNYSSLSGTSMAAPHVAGTVAAMFSAACKSFIDKYREYPDSFALQVKDYLLQGAEWNSTLNNKSTTGGRLNLFRSVSLLKQFDCDSCGFTANLNVTPITCKNEDDGRAEITVNNRSTTSFSILWGDSLTTATRQHLIPGFYTASVTDTFTGCTRMVAGAYHNPDSIAIISLLASAPGEGAPGTIVVQATASNEVLMYSIDGINYQPTSVFSVGDTGTYNVYIKNSSGCILERTITVRITGLNELEDAANSFQLYPNPTENLVTLYFSNPKTLVEVFDLTGRRVFETIPVAEKTVISTQLWQNGVYLVKAAGREQKLVVVH